jgi:hypothetical protein
MRNGTVFDATVRRVDLEEIGDARTQATATRCLDDALPFMSEELLHND